MRVVLWDTSRGLGSLCGGDLSLPGESWAGRNARSLFRLAFPLDRQPVALELAYLLAIFRRQRHSVEYAEDDVPRGGDLYVFRPRLATLAASLAAIEEARAWQPAARLLVVGPAGSRWPELFTARGAIVLKGEAEQLHWHLSDVLECPASIVHLGAVEELDRLPWPDWSWFEPERFRLRGQVTWSPCGLVEHSRWADCRLGRQPQQGTIDSTSLRYRAAERVVSELRHQISTYGFQSFQFCDPRFAADRKQAVYLADLMGRLPRRIEFSVQAAHEDLSEELLRPLARAGLVSVRFDVPCESGTANDSASLGRLEPWRELTALCRGLGVRTTARFLLPCQDRPQKGLKAAWRMSARVNSTRAEFCLMPSADWRPAEANWPAFSLGWFNRYYARAPYLLGKLRRLWPQGEQPPLERNLVSAREADAPHPQTPRPLGGLDAPESASGLRKDGPHQRSLLRRKQGHD